MCTKYPEIWNALSAPFHADNVKQKTETSKKTGRTFTCDYVTARTVMNRLDDVLGPENWWDDYTPVEHGAICRLTFRLPDGQILTKVDSGADSSELKDAGDADKGGFSDAFKRAAVKFGPGRYLYKDGVVSHGEPPAVAAPPAVRRAITAPTILATAAQIPAAPVPAPPPPAPAAAPKPAIDKPKKPLEVKTGLQLYRFTESCRIDRDLLRWMLATFTQFPSKVSNWSDSQVAYALPEIKTHLEAVMAAKKGQVA